jgi:hypothetical protein
MLPVLPLGRKFPSPMVAFGDGLLALPASASEQV